MKKVLFLIFASLLVLGACGQDEDKSNKEDNKKSESKSNKKSNNSKKDKKAKDSSSDDKQKASSGDNNDDTANNEAESISKNDNSKTQSDNSNKERPQQGKQAQATQQNNNGYMTQDEINEWNKNKPTTHDESQMGYGRGDYEQALKESQKVWNNPNAHVGGPRWVGKNEGYESWAKRQQEVQNSVAE